MQYTFGVDVGGTAIKYGLFGDGLIEKWASPTRVDANGSQILPDIAAALAACQARHSITPGQITGIGIGVPGPVDAAGRVNRCVNLNWGVFNICQALEALTGLPVRAGNDANVAALGEYYDGGGQGCRSMVMVTFGTGVGGGIILDGKILNGAHGVGGEIGHIVVNRDEPVACTCGKRGCVEQYASAPGICRAAQQALAATDAPSLLRRLEPGTCKEIFACAAQGDAVAAQVLDRTFAYMGEFLADVCCVIDPQRVVLGGGVSAAGQQLLDGIAPHFHRFMFHACRGTEFALATLGNAAGIYGAASLFRSDR